MKPIAIFLSVAALAAPAKAGGPEDIASATFGIPGPAANRFAEFPQPSLVKLDLCVLSELKNNKCFFKCQSGAVVTEPAVRPGFSAGEPAGPCAPYITREIKVAKTDRAVSLDQLEDLLEDPSAQVRRAAVITARDYVQHSSIQERVLRIMNHPDELEATRVEAARSISRAAGNWSVQDELKDLIGDVRQPRALRVMAYKALWGAAAANYSLQDFLQDAAKGDERDLAARKAAVWAMFDFSRNSVAQDVLLGLLKDARQDEGLRLEALKSLFSAAADYKVKAELLDLAKTPARPKALRLAAVKALSGIGYDYEARRACEDLAKYDRDPEIRAEAVIAMEPDYAELREFFHLAYRVNNNPYGPFVNPIDRE